MKKKLSKFLKWYSDENLSGEEIDDVVDEYLTKESTKKEVLKRCKHSRIEEIQGGQIEKCRDCGKTWGD